MKKIQKNAARFDNLKQDFLDDKKYSGTAAREATVCEMQMQDISFDDRTITFRHLKNKHVQLLPMSEALASCLKKYRLGHLYRSLAVNFSEPTPLQQAAQTYIHLLFLRCKRLVGKSQTLSNLRRPGAGCAMKSLSSTKACWSPDVKKKRQSR